MQNSNHVNYEPPSTKTFDLDLWTTDQMPVSLNLVHVRYEFSQLLFYDIERTNCIKYIIIKIISGAGFDNRNAVAIVKRST